MYHTTDTHLFREDTIIDDVGNNEVIDVVICQDCDFKEKWMHKEVKVKEGNIDYDLNKYRLFVVDVRNKYHEFNIKVKVGDTNTFDWFTKDELEILNN
jgi:hypothetical protein